VREKRGAVSAFADRADARGGECALDSARDRQRRDERDRSGGTADPNDAGVYRAGRAISIQVSRRADVLYRARRLVRRVVLGGGGRRAYEWRITSTSPSLTMYSLPSRRNRPFSRTPG